MRVRYLVELPLIIIFVTWKAVDECIDRIVEKSSPGFMART